MIQVLRLKSSRDVVLTQEIAALRAIRGLKILCRFTDSDCARSILCAVLVCIVFVLAQGKVALAEGGPARAFLGPRKDFTTMLRNPKGLTMQLKILEIQGAQQSIEQKICCFPLNSGDGLQSTYYRLNFRADGNRIIMVERGNESTLLDLRKDSWSIPLDIFTLGADISSSTLAQCSIVSRYEALLLNKEREVIVVECRYSMQGMSETVIQHSFASDLGLVQLYDFKLNGLGE